MVLIPNYGTLLCAVSTNMCDKNYSNKNNLINTAKNLQTHHCPVNNAAQLLSSVVPCHYYSKWNRDPSSLHQCPTGCSHCSKAMQMQKTSELFSLVIAEKQLWCLHEKPAMTLLVSSFFRLCVSEGERDGQTQISYTFMGNTSQTQD